jgi:2-polyprenyl-6-methoxyphenol hydroxylase-like FAD-dependent oxidoreductase
MTPVVIVGAGPCGLTAACELRRFGIPVRLLEAAPEAHSGSRAIQLWPPALEIFRELGFLDEAERRGVRIRATTYHLAGGRILRVELGSRNEPLLLPQEQTSLLLEEALEKLGGRVERGTRVTGVANAGDTVVVKAQGPEGTALIEAQWLIAADGVRSDVRRQLGIEFPGQRVSTTFLLAEGQVEGEYEHGAVHYFLGRTGSFVFAPMRGKVRISAAIPADTSLTLEGVQRLIDDRGPGNLRVSKLETLTTFTSDERIAASLRRGRCFLVGDAAHTHSPLGGQGLNLGLQDVHNLAWKLAGVIDRRFDESILDSYETERSQAAAQVVRNTRKFIRVFTLRPMAAQVRNVTWRALRETGVLRSWFVPLLAGRRIRYATGLGERPLGAGTGPGHLLSRLLPRPGTRSPYWVPASGSGPKAACRLLTMGPPGGDLVGLGRAVAEGQPALVSHEHLGQRRAGFLLLRPDGYVAARGTTAAELAQAERLVQAMARISSHQRGNPDRSDDGS